MFKSEVCTQLMNHATQNSYTICFVWSSFIVFICTLSRPHSNVHMYASTCQKRLSPWIEWLLRRIDLIFLYSVHEFAKGKKKHFTSTMSHQTSTRHALTKSTKAAQIGTMRLKGPKQPHTYVHVSNMSGSGTTKRTRIFCSWAVCGNESTMNLRVHTW